MTRSVKQLDAEIAAFLKEAEANAADYVGKARARAMAKAGHFHELYERSKRAPAQNASPDRYEVTTLGGASVQRSSPSESDAKKLADKHQPADHALELWRVSGATGKRSKVASRVRWDAVNKRRYWEDE